MNDYDYAADHGDNPQDLMGYPDGPTPKQIAFLEELGLDPQRIDAVSTKYEASNLIDKLLAERKSADPAVPESVIDWRGVRMCATCLNPVQQHVQWCKHYTEHEPLPRIFRSSFTNPAEYGFAMMESELAWEAERQRIERIPEDLIG